MLVLNKILFLGFVTVIASMQAQAENHFSGDTTPTEPPPLATSPSGRFRGSWMEARRGRRFQAYRGIRYAEPPVGPLRFQPPKPILHYAEEVDATEDGPAAPQPTPPGYHVDEDCLRVNVYTPGRYSSQLLPVLFYIHSGGFYSMSGRSDLAGPHYLLDRDLVLVTINYRLGSLGFLSTGDERAPGNNGMKDQVAALRWVQRNIASFGGDPDLVTIAGCSAGARSVMLHMISTMSKGLFHRAISMSGAIEAKGHIGHDQRSLAVKQAELLGCPSKSSDDILNCLKTKTWKQLGDSLSGFYEFGYDPVGLWKPVVEKDFGQERFLTMEPVEAIRQGKMHAVPYIISQTKDEFFWKAFTILKNDTLLHTMNSEWKRIAPISLMLPRDSSVEKLDRLRLEYLGGKELINDTESAAALGRLYGDAITGFSVHRMANLMSRHSPQPVYYYEFAYVGQHSHYEDPTTKKPTGAVHHDDLIYLFTLRYRFPDVALHSADSDVVDKMTGIFYHFAKHGEPQAPELGAVSWPRLTPTERRYLRVGRQLEMCARLKEERLRVWDELYPVQED